MYSHNDMVWIQELLIFASLNAYSFTVVKVYLTHMAFGMRETLPSFFFPTFIFNLVFTSMQIFLFLIFKECEFSKLKQTVSALLISLHTTDHSEHETWP